ncbi:HNH endonuclease signature motif containing protein [Streptomyces sp. NPDC101062]|uniref:HNH endonuclease signature motif containing protein n=1 Tax=unclassified Streptomyces TaxID=2593676 RepID=UPI003801E2DB
MPEPYDRDRLTAAVSDARSWADLMRRLGLRSSGGRRRTLQRKVADLGIDTSHFKQRSPWRKYPDEVIAAAVATSTTLREVVIALGAPPATGTLSHIARRIKAAGIDISHFPGMNPTRTELPFTTAELADAAARADSVRGVARILGVPDDGRSRAALGRMLKERGIGTVHFRHARLAIPEAALRAAISDASSYADVMRSLGLQVNDTNHRRVRRKAAQLGLATSHFKRRGWGTAQPRAPRPVADDTLVVLPPGSPRTNRPRLHRALDEIGVPYRCASCGNTGAWLGRPITLQIDHISGDWLDNRAENLRYLCPNCHALTDTWCRSRRKRYGLGGQVGSRSPEGTSAR